MLKSVGRISAKFPTRICLTPLTKRFYQLPIGSRKIVPVYPPVQTEPAVKNATLLQKLSEIDLKENLDTDGWRFNLIDKNKKDCIRAGDIIRIVYNKEKCSYDNFIGYILSVDRKERIQDASVLLRNQISKVMVEVRVPLFSPLVERVDILKRADGSRKRNKHYYIRGTKLDVGNLESKLRKK
ncbi:similar to Saccharomyces cerevisiae YCR046C IMG1 Mitochondrial ribosomal protein of the large subunit, required for respiration and for maintenance of the mitochondrial genome [Maudiozyma barnettii]|uniref:Similar to Saccharomyces cerevisiae YCR046C IMG1 Mitochondrial ribosomal protein of the large subunit, required for respiration and for maintenance of the mitochondrial genome n=1 Tax=Maudiozyma barnettii TaxID=61262 RepID=A0A8H2ZEH2_9SACH|nr:mitochondrial 54S ribosomal protein IMG1 [Kazachstania barnettii]CAB4252281.1 similar to Saccharomyces cerevisiae YCR046C IMG1 Mitochondrial ribosomal protein of the large subunit, required for respiration and for maintenance of the mitochondrial genome [Kazachstania barnettii]CAD1778981.1 similar to Saccharomyces cerevisiae YCR046C IMG1 Mitochondrial ribosomal protein of the large subunit, required for respiration and for maintenance of the mitochondrial genome [Kazachstania barnettii]